MLYIPYIFAPYPHGIPHNGSHPLTRVHQVGHCSHIRIHPLNRVHHVSHSTFICIHPFGRIHQVAQCIHREVWKHTHVMAMYVSLYFDTPVFGRVTPISRYLYTLELSIDTVVYTRVIGLHRLVWRAHTRDRYRLLYDAHTCRVFKRYLYKL